MNGLEELNICVPQLCNLKVCCSRYPKVLNLVAPQLQNLTASVDFIDVLLHCCDLLQKPVKGFSSLEKVNLTYFNLSHSKLLGVFQKLYSAKFLILDAYIIKVLSSCLDQLLLEPCPFTYLKCLKLNTMLELPDGRHIATAREHVVVPVQLKNYFLDKCPSATFITDYPQVPHKRPPMQNVDNHAIANNLANSEAEINQPNTLSKDKRLLDEKILMQDQVTTKHKEMFDAEIEMQDKGPQKRSSQQVHDDATAKKIAKLDLEKQQQADTNTITEANEMLDANIQIQDEVNTKKESVFRAMFEEKIQMQDEAFTKQKAMFEAHIQMLDQVIIKQKALFEAKIQMQDEVITGQKAMFENERQMQDQVITKQKAMFEAKIQMLDQVSTNQKAKIQMQDNVIGA